MAEEHVEHLVEVAEEHIEHLVEVADKEPVVEPTEESMKEPISKHWLNTEHFLPINLQFQ